MAFLPINRWFKWSLILLLMVLVGVAGWFPFKRMMLEHYGELTLTSAVELVLLRSGLKTAAKPVGKVLPPQPAPEPIELGPTVRPFRQIGKQLGPEADNFDLVSIKGATIFDANGDGLADLFFARNQRPIAKRVSDDGVLSDEYYPAHPNVLFLNQGNDAAGNPQFRSLQQLQQDGNKQFVKEELLIEGKYRPRSSIDDDPYTIGRIGEGAISADFNGDGRLDLYLLNGHFGLPYQTHEVGARVYPPRRNLGRQGRTDPLVVTMPPFLKTGGLVDGLTTMLNFGDQPEAEGSNRLYLNMGDQDGDGLPEWQDVTDQANVVVTGRR